MAVKVRCASGFLFSLFYVPFRHCKIWNVSNLDFDSESIKEFQPRTWVRYQNSSTRDIAVPEENTVYSVKHPYASTIHIRLTARHFTAEVACDRVGRQQQAGPRLTGCNPSPCGTPINGPLHSRAATRALPKVPPERSAGGTDRPGKECMKLRDTQ